MKKILNKILIIAAVLVISTMFSYATEEGYIDVSVTAPESFQHSIMINLIDDAGINYVETAEPVNSWRCNAPLPAGDYIVDYVSMDAEDGNYSLEYPKILNIVTDKGTAFNIKVTHIGEKASSEGNEPKLDASADVQRERLTFGQRLLQLIRTVLMDNIATFIVMAVLLIFLVRRWGRRKREDENY